MRLTPQSWHRVAKTTARIMVVPEELVQNVLSTTHRSSQPIGISALLIRIEKRICNKCCADQVRRCYRYQDFATLPGETVPPAPVWRSRRTERDEPLDHQSRKIFLAGQPPL